MATCGHGMQISVLVLPFIWAAFILCGDIYLVNDTVRTVHRFLSDIPASTGWPLSPDSQEVPFHLRFPDDLHSSTLDQMQFDTSVPVLLNSPDSAEGWNAGKSSSLRRAVTTGSAEFSAETAPAAIPISSSSPLSNSSATSANPPSCEPHVWVRLGLPSCGATPADVRRHLLEAFPPFREEPRVVPTMQSLLRIDPEDQFSPSGLPAALNGLPAPWQAFQSRPSSVAARTAPTLDMDVMMWRTVRLFVTLLSHYGLRFWILASSLGHSPVAIGMDLYSVWVLLWIGKVFRDPSHKLTVDPDFFTEHPEPWQAKPPVA
eukprot:RCo040205